MYKCPVCQYPGLRDRPYESWPPPPEMPLSPPYEDLLGSPSYEVCPRCGFEFGNDDNPGTGVPSSFEQYRLEWESEGCPWFDVSRESEATPPQPGRDDDT